MNKKDYQRPEILVVSIRQTHIICGTAKGVQRVNNSSSDGIIFTEEFEDTAGDY